MHARSGVGARVEGVLAPDGERYAAAIGGGAGGLVLRDVGLPRRGGVGVEAAGAAPRKQGIGSGVMVCGGGFAAV